MIVLLDPHADAATVDAVRARARELGLDVTPLDGPKGLALAVSGPSPLAALELRGVPGVMQVLSRRRRLVGGEPLWPHFGLRVLLVGLLLLAVVALLAGFLSPGLGDDASALAGKPAVHDLEWYLRPPAELAERLPGAGAVLLGLLWAALLLLPLIDRADTGTPYGRLFVLVLRAAGVLVIASLVYLGLA